MGEMRKLINSHYIIRESCDTSHFPIEPCQYVEHDLTAFTSFAVDFGENAVVAVHVVRDIDPNEPANMPSLLAFE